MLFGDEELEPLDTVSAALAADDSVVVALQVAQLLSPSSLACANT